jgi:hypothetical protein
VALTEGPLKRGTPRHPKVKCLARRLKIKTYSAVGLLEMLWQFTAEFHPAGDVGRVADEIITEALDWEKDPAVLISALVAEKFLDEHPTYRLIVHDWPAHAEDSVHMKLARVPKLFANGSVPKYNRLTGKERAHADAFYADLPAHGVRTEAHESARRDPSGLASRHGMATNTSLVEKPSNNHEPPTRARSEEEPLPWYREFLELWMKPCECCGILFTAVQVDLGAQVWMQLESSGKIAAAIIPVVMAGLRLHRASKSWHEGYVPAVPSFLGWSKDGRPGAPRWNDKPAPFVPEIERQLPKSKAQISQERAEANFLASVERRAQ